METEIGKIAGDLAGVASRKWFVAMGIAGLVILVFALIKGTPHDDVMIAGIAATMVGFGFGEAECRTIQQSVGPNFIIKRPVWRLTFTGAILYMIAAAGLVTALVRVVR